MPTSESTEYDVTLILEQRVRVTVAAGSDAITRVTGPDGDDWRAAFYDLYTKSEVLRMLAASALFVGMTDGNQLDGWADLADDEVTMEVTDKEPRIEDVFVVARKDGT